MLIFVVELDTISRCLQKTHDPSGSDTNNSENHGNWGCRHKLRKSRGRLKSSVPGRNLKHKSEARENQIPREQ